LLAASIEGASRHARTLHGRSRHCEVVDIDGVAVELYGLDPDQFTAARNEKTKEARVAGAIAVSNQIETRASRPWRRG